MPEPSPQSRLTAWFADQGWEPFPFQEAAWGAWQAGESGLIHAPTGLGKTFAAWGGPLLDGMASDEPTDVAPPIRLLWITPLRALAGDTLYSLQQPLDALGLGYWQVELRTGDTSSSVRQRQRKRLPTALITTPESLSLLLSYPDWQQLFRSLQTVVVDEWHELLGTKRGVQTELGLARLRGLLPDLRSWGLSATLGNLDQAMACLLGPKQAGRLIRGVHDKQIVVETAIPPDMERFPWAGHLGIKQVQAVAKAIRQARTSLVFTNTRAQTEIWYQALRDALPEETAAGQIGVHHGSIDREDRMATERALDAGTLKAVVCTSSLDLGVDFTPVDQVVQIGSPKGVARLMQRAGRSGHQPGAVSRILGVPTNALELVEFAAARDAIRRGEIEAREPVREPLDVLVQHLATCALGGGFDPEALRAEVRATYAYQDLNDTSWAWALTFVTRGGKALAAYPQFTRVQPDPETGRLTLPDPRLARQHRMSIGTITSDAAVAVRIGNGRVIGSVEEWFISRLKPGDVFSFAGRRLQLVRFRDMVARCKPATRAKGSVPSWQGGRSPLSSELAHAVSRLMADPSIDPDAPELHAAEAVLEIQRTWSAIPHDGLLLVESTRVRQGYHVAFFPFAGRLVHEGLSALVAYRLGREITLSVRTTPNDYGFSLQTPKSWEPDEALVRSLFTPDNLLDDLVACMNAAELARRQFREIARVSGLVLQGFPGRQSKTNRQLQVSSGLLFDVFERYDPENLLLRQARREILERQLELTRLRGTLDRLSGLPVRIVETERLTPLAFPLWADQLGATVNTESRDQQIARMLASLERAVE
ncbi:MAG: ligase-associated DNA damage response DEXH box helicase [Opitutales bacterium]